MKRRVLLLILLLLLVGVAFFIYERRRAKIPDDTLLLYGNVDVRQVDLGFRVLGRVTALQFEEGDLVKAGDLMASLDKQPYFDQLLQARASLDATLVSLQYAEKVFHRREELIGDGSVSFEDLENAQTSKDGLQENLKQATAAVGVAETDLRDTEIFAPNDGIILTRIREPGSVVTIGQPVYTLSLSDPVWVRAYVSEPNLGVIYAGQPAEVYTDSQHVYRGHIGFISPVAEFTPKTVETTELRTDLVYRLRIIVDNPDHLLKQGMPVTVKLQKDVHHRS